jgi:D-tyrosyl-tRNA(Tyr) deacylase
MSPAPPKKRGNRAVKALLQRVNRASVSISGEELGGIGKGLVVFVGVAGDDSSKDAQYLVQKLVNLRIFSDEDGKLNLSVLETGGELLLVSQFTLLADTRRGRRPSFVEAAPPEAAESLLEEFVAMVRDTGLKVATGRFQQHMLVEIHNDGPVTIMLDSKEKLQRE